MQQEAYALHEISLNGGKITQRGTHEELSAQSGLYADFIHAREEAASWKLA